MQQEVAHSPEAILIVATNPVDIIFGIVSKLSALPVGRVFGTGTVLDTGVRRAAYRIIEDKGVTNHGIGAGIAHILRVIRDDAQAVLTVLVPSTASEHLEAACLSPPRVVCANGTIKTVHLSLVADEQKAIEQSARILREATGELRGRPFSPETASIREFAAPAQATPSR